MPDSPPVNLPPENRLSRLDDEARWRASRRRHWITDIVVTLVIVGLGVVAWYAYPVFRKHQAGIAELPDIQKAVGSVRDGLQSASSKFDQWTTDQQIVRDRTEQALRELRARVETVKQDAGEAAASLTERVQSELGSKVDKVQTQLAELQSNRKDDQERIASLERDLKEVREQTARQEQDLNAVRQQVQDQEALDQRQLSDVTDLKQSESRDRHDLDRLNDKLAVERVDFEVSKNRQSDVAPGITLAVTGIDLPYQRISGWVRLAQDRRTIWIRNHGEQEPLEFYGIADNRKRELVITHMTGDSVAGYLLLPKATGTAGNAPAS